MYTAYSFLYQELHMQIYKSVPSFNILLPACVIHKTIVKGKVDSRAKESEKYFRIKKN